MSKDEASAIQAGWARAVVDSLYSAGVELGVVSPGSRSTPLVLAAARSGMALETIIDERSAGFFALGRARADGRPVALICTSGTAGAHYYPALIEASEAFVPLVIVTADRPPELRGCMAAQTIEQAGLFGGFTRRSLELGPPTISAAGLRALRRTIAAAVHDARYPCPGPVHINAPARKPLEPPPAGDPATLEVERRVDELLGTFNPRAQTLPTTRADDEVIDALVRACGAERGLIVAGPMIPDRFGAGDRAARAALALARATGYPLLYEASSGLRSWIEGDAAATEHAVVGIENFGLSCEQPSLSANAPPELIIRVGRPPATSAWAQYLSDHVDCRHVVISEHGWPDPEASVDVLVRADPADTMQRVAVGVAGQMARRGGASRDRRAWAESWAKASRIARAVVDRTLADADRSAGMREGAAMRAVIEGVPPHSTILIGNGLPVRTIDIYVPATKPLRILAQRGANGIDGWISAAAGTAWDPSTARAAAGSSAVVAMIGDVAFAHDLGGLAVAARARRPLCIVVIDNAGGRIFEQLPLARTENGAGSAVFDECFLTRPRGCVRLACACFAVDYRRIERPGELTDAVAQACTRDGCTVVHVVVAPRSAHEDLEQIRSALRLAALTGAEP